MMASSSSSCRRRCGSGCRAPTSKAAGSPRPRPRPPRAPHSPRLGDIMDRSLKWRTLALLVGLLLCAGLLAPTWPGSDALPSWFPFKKKISLGLDLQGGVHIVYSIALERAVDDKASDIKRDLEARFADDRVDAKVKLPAALGAVTVIPSASVDAAKQALIEKHIQDYRDVSRP